MTTTSEITVIDSLMGLGKTTYILSRLREEALNVSAFTGRPRTKLLVIVPLLSEIERYQRALPAFAFKEPSEFRTTKLRKQGHGKNFYDLMRLVEDGENIITTHSLFSKMDRDLYAKPQAAGYELIIDEALETVTLYKGLSTHDLGILKDQNMVSVDPETWRLVWNQDDWGDYAGARTAKKSLLSMLVAAAQSGTQNSASETHLRVRRPRPVLRAK